MSTAPTALTLAAREAPLESHVQSQRVRSSQMPPLDKLSDFHGMTIRYTNLPESVALEHQVGAEVLYSAFTSTAIYTGMKPQALGKHCLLIRSKSGKRIAPYSNIQTEQEVLFRAGSKFKVLERNTVGDRVEFLLEEVSDKMRKP